MIIKNNTRIDLRKHKPHTFISLLGFTLEIYCFIYRSVIKNIEIEIFFLIMYIKRGSRVNIKRGPWSVVQ